MFRGILFGLGAWVISLIIYWFYVRSKLPGLSVIDPNLLLRTPANFGYGVAIGIRLMSTGALLMLRAFQAYGRHAAGS